MLPKFASCFATPGILLNPSQDLSLHPTIVTFWEKAVYVMISDERFVCINIISNNVVGGVTSSDLRLLVAPLATDQLAELLKPRAPRILNSNSPHYRQQRRCLLQVNLVIRFNSLLFSLRWSSSGRYSLDIYNVHTQAPQIASLLL